MPISVSEHEHLVYISYHRQEFKDSERLKRTLGNQMSALSQKDVVLDVSTCNSLTSPEIGSIVRLLQIFQGTARYLRIVTNPEVHKALEATNVMRLENFVLYKSQKQFVEELKNSAGPAKR